MSGSGAIIQPIRQPVMACDLETELAVTVRAAIPGSAPILKCVASKHNRP
jgi:hypothetical protein